MRCVQMIIAVEDVSQLDEKAVEYRYERGFKSGGVEEWRMLEE